MAIEDKSDGRTVQLKRVRLSFTKRLKTKGKTSDEATKETHGLNIIIDKSQPTFDANVAKCESALREAGKQAFKNENAYKDIAEDAPKRVCYRKGEKFKNKEGKVYAGYEGNMAFGANGPSGGEKRPKLLDRHKRKVEEADINDVFYGGCYADVIVSFYGTEKGSRGIFATIEAIRSHQEGERMGGGVDVDADDFDDLPDDDDSFVGGSSSKDDDDLLLG
jgi:hypothetical protein